MSKKKLSFSQWQNTGGELDQYYLKKFRIYPPFLYRCLDRWLKEMSHQGWHVVHCGAIFFWFEKGLPAEKEYFTYGLSTQEGKYNLSLRHPLLEKKYGVKAKKSKINANKEKKYQIVEIDLDKINVENDIGYIEMLHDRDNLYLQYFTRNLIVLIIILIVLVIILTNPGEVTPFLGR